MVLMSDEEVRGREGKDVAVLLKPSELSQFRPCSIFTPNNGNDHYPSTV